MRSVYDGESAVSIAQQFQPEVVLLDIRLPDMSGYEVMQRLKEMDGNRRGKFIGIERLLW